MQLGHLGFTARILMSTDAPACLSPITSIRCCRAVCAHDFRVFTAQCLAALSQV